MAHGLKPARLLCPWDFPGKKAGVGSHALLQGIFLTQRSNPGLLHCRQILYHLSYQGSPSNSSDDTSLKQNTSYIDFTLWFRKLLPNFILGSAVGLHPVLTDLLIWSITEDNTCSFYPAGLNFWSPKYTPLFSPSSTCVLLNNFTCCFPEYLSLFVFPKVLPQKGRILHSVKSLISPAWLRVPWKLMPTGQAWCVSERLATLPGKSFRSLTYGASHFNSPLICKMRKDKYISGFQAGVPSP